MVSPVQYIFLYDPTVPRPDWPGLGRPTWHSPLSQLLLCCFSFDFFFLWKCGLVKVFIAARSPTLLILRLRETAFTSWTGPISIDMVHLTFHNTLIQYPLSHFQDKTSSFEDKIVNPGFINNLLSVTFLVNCLPDNVYFPNSTVTINTIPLPMNNWSILCPAPKSERKLPIQAALTLLEISSSSNISQLCFFLFVTSCCTFTDSAFSEKRYSIGVFWAVFWYVRSLNIYFLSHYLVTSFSWCDMSAGVDGGFLLVVWRLLAYQLVSRLAADETGAQHCAPTVGQKAMGNLELTWMLHALSHYKICLAILLLMSSWPTCASLSSNPGNSNLELWEFQSRRHALQDVWKRMAPRGNACCSTNVFIRCLRFLKMVLVLSVESWCALESVVVVSGIGRICCQKISAGAD